MGKINLTNMKANWWTCLILLLVGTVFQLSAQTETNRGNGWHPPTSDQIIQPVPSGAATNTPATNAPTLTSQEARIAKFKADAEKGDCLAEINLAFSYDWNRDPQSLSNAIYWFEKAAVQDHPPATLAKLQLGYIYKTVVKDYGKAAIWFRKAAEVGDVGAQFELGALYERFGQMAEDADKLLNTSTNLALPFINFGIPYNLNNNAIQDYQEAVKWYRKAAEAGDAYAQFKLGTCYYYGRGVNQDYAEAANWYRTAANQGDVDAEQGLGFMYDMGQGVPQDYVEAYKWDNLAAAQGDKYASYNRDALVSSMTPDQIAEAQQLTRQFKPRKASNATGPVLSDIPVASGTGFFITDDGYLISNYHVVKDATKVRVVTSAGLIDV